MTPSEPRWWKRCRDRARQRGDLRAMTRYRGPALPFPSTPSPPWSPTPLTPPETNSSLFQPHQGHHCYDHNAIVLTATMQTASGNLRDGFPEESQVCRRECCHRQFRAALTATEQVVNTFNSFFLIAIVSSIFSTSGRRSCTCARCTSTSWPVPTKSSKPWRKRKPSRGTKLSLIAVDLDCLLLLRLNCQLWPVPTWLSHPQSGPSKAVRKWKWLVRKWKCLQKVTRTLSSTYNDDDCFFLYQLCPFALIAGLGSENK